MTRKDYIVIAAAIKEGLPTGEEAPLDYQRGKAAACEIIAWAMAAACREDNFRFDRERFLRACGLAP